MQRVLIIAEAGVNHNGSLVMAKQLVDVAKNAGADVVKFQTFVTEESISMCAPLAEYQRANVGECNSQVDLVKKLELNESAHLELISYCEKKGIEFLSTPFDKTSADLLVKLGIKKFKIPSGEITNLPFLRYAVPKFSEFIVSTGMSDLHEISWAMNFLKQLGVTPNQITILHCNTEYPTPFSDVNLRAMQSIQKEFGTKVGYSDHTLGIEVPIAAVALGASVIEKHITLDKSLPGPDHKASLDPQELASMVRAIRNIETALGSSQKMISASAAKNQSIAKKSIVAKVKITAGDIFSEQNITTKRPGRGLDPRDWDKVVGQVAKRNFDVDELIDL